MYPIRKLYFPYSWLLLFTFSLFGFNFALKGNINLSFRDIVKNQITFGGGNPGILVEWSGFFTYDKTRSFLIDSPNNHLAISENGLMNYDTNGVRLTHRLSSGFITITTLDSDVILDEDEINIFRRGVVFGFFGDRLFISDDYIPGEYFEGALFISNRRLSDYSFLVNSASSTPLDLHGNDEHLSILIVAIPEANKLPLALGSMVLLIIGYKRFRKRNLI